MKRNKGFSLIELIVVIAIMALLAGVIAPMLIKYINKTRISKDMDTGSEIAKAIITVVTEEGVCDNAEEHAEPHQVSQMDGNDFKSAVVGHLSVENIEDLKVNAKHDINGELLENGSPQFYYTLDPSKNKVEVFMGGTTGEYRIYPSAGSKFAK